jgi:hypothetical protein
VQFVIKILEEGDGALNLVHKKVSGRGQGKVIKKEKKKKYTWEELSEMEYIEKRRRGWGY